uniref:Thiamine biosynthesis protein S n=1 Tax=Schimmelmannia schousboei TaxID=173468 RepID=A0A1C9C8X5_9FLOR|nr:thiamine biosynthesis protein S [Schimmelmannia schousboei]AOM64830.1 thiamine biosynthesis protein S [Schimmelmannia schousboei]
MFMIYNTIFVNGQAFNCCQSMSLKSILLYLEFDLNMVAVEYNQEIITNNHFDNIFLKSNDCLEVITIVGGG